MKQFYSCTENNAFLSNYLSQVKLHIFIMAQSSSASGTSSRRHLRDHDSSSTGSTRYADGDWETKEVRKKLFISALSSLN